MSEQKIIIGHCLDVLKDMEDECIDVCITSPPYWALRDYGSEPVYYGDWKGQLGLEDNPNDYVKHLIMVFDEIKRVLKPTGACWVNLGDTYSSNVGFKYSSDYITGKLHVNSKPEGNFNVSEFTEKSLCQIPSRFAIAMTDHGWILRNEVIWYKPNVMPVSVKDRFTVDFEKFFFFTKKPKYYFKQQREPIKEDSIARAKRAKHNTLDSKNVIRGTNAIDMKHNDPNWQRFANPEGRNARCVWEIATKGEHFEHVAMFPLALIERPIKSCCPEGGVVLDPFAGSGTTLRYCFEHDIDCIGIEINPKYKDIIKRKARLGQRKLI